jgi:hypothetical protein
MSLLAESQAWVSECTPDGEEIRQTIDNLAHKHAVAAPAQRHELVKSIHYLCGLLSVDPNTVVLAPEPALQTPNALDASPLVDPQLGMPEGMQLSSAEKLARFTALREELARPF